MIKYPIEIELSNKCSLNCISCISKEIVNKGEINIKNIDLLLNFIKLNFTQIDYITIGGLGDNFLHTNILVFLDKLKELKNFNLNILIPTKGISLNQNIILKIKELKENYGLNINLQIGIFSLLEKTQNFLSGLYIKDKGLKFNYFSIFKKNIVLLKKNKLDFSLELLLTKFSENEIEKFTIFCKKLEVDGVIHRLHNFGGKLKTYDYLYSNLNNYNAFHCSYNKSLENDKENYYNDKCGFFPYIDYNLNIYPGTFCTHYNVGNVNDYNFKGGFLDILKKCHNIIDLNNFYCKKCIDNLNNK